MARGGVDDQLGGLVQDNQGVVLEEDIEGHLLGSLFGRGRGRNPDGDQITPADLVGGGLSSSIDGDQAFVNDFLDSRAREGKAFLGQIVIEPLFRLSGVDLEDPAGLREVGEPFSGDVPVFGVSLSDEVNAD